MNPLVPITAIGAALVGSIGIVAAATRHDGPTYPDRWDPRVADLVTFVEDERGHDYLHPVEVDFLTPEEYSERTRGDASDLSGDDQAAVDASEGLLRALGMVTGDIDLFEATNDLNDTGTLAYYDFGTKTVTVRGTEVTPGIAVTLVHELTHVLQDQYFDLGSIELDETSGAETAFRALVEGDATRVETVYEDSLSDEDRAEVESENDDDIAAVDEEGIPEALQAIFGMPYALGPPFVDFLYADDGNDSVDDAFRHPPSTEEHILDPYRYLDHDLPDDVGAVPEPEGADAILDGGDFGAASLYLVLAARIDSRQALDAALGWGGDRYLHYLDGADQSCVDLRVTGDSDTDTDELGTALDAWAAAGPAGAATVERGDDVVTLHACDPGGDAEVAPPNSAIDALSLGGVRAELLSGVVDGDLGEDFGECFVDGLLHTFTFDELVSDTEPENFDDRMGQIAATCPP